MSFTLITGGARSGKSSFSEQHLLSLNKHPQYYLATTPVNDRSMDERVEKHQKDRDKKWITFEEPLFIDTLSFESNGVLLMDCVTLWLNSIFQQCNFNVDNSLSLAKSIWLTFEKNIPENSWIITNELGMGLHAETEAGRKFADLQGWMNQFLAQRAQEVILMVSGLPLKIKSGQ
ncbi:MAG: adenosylcobinamide kinase/adenosylcobinamide-phosphate guanylyltransferase [Luteibaculaceae bacterium]|jgi:adenosylcobinamide kinase/adenosylcobinamide-phosphate guanylyltransferase